MSELFQLPSESCPFCGSCRPARLMGADTIDVARSNRREYSCAECGRRWSVDGCQDRLFADEGVGQLQLPG